MKRTTKVLILIYILIVVCLAVVIYVVPSVTGMLTSTVVIEYGNLTDTDRQRCYFIRDEKVYSAASSGDVNYYFEDGVKIRKNTTVLSMGSGAAAPEESEYADVITKLGTSAIVKSDYTSEFKGVVSYYIDGYEGYFTPENITSLKHSDVKNLKIGEPINLTRSVAYNGEPLYKICKNELWYVTCWVSDGNIAKYQVGNNVTFELPLGKVDATVTQVIDCGDEWQVVFETTYFYEEFARIRTSEVDIVTSDYSGIIVPNSCIATEDGQIGVYVKYKTGDYIFTPINIIASDGEFSAVSESYYYDDEGNKVNTVIVYDEILKNPEKEHDKADDKAPAD